MLPGWCFLLQGLSRSQAVLGIKAPSTELHRLNSTQGTHTNRLQTNYQNIYSCQKTQPNSLPARLRHRRNLLRSCLSTSYRTNLSAGNTNILPPCVSFSSRFARQGSPEVLPRGRGVQPMLLAGKVAQTRLEESLSSRIEDV